MSVYEIRCLPPNEPYRVVRIRAATLEEALQRAERLWMRQCQRPQLLAIVDEEPQVPLVRFG